MAAPARMPRRTAGAPAAPLRLLAALVAASCAVPLAYVLVRAAGAGWATWSRLLDRRVPELLLNTLGLAAAVGALTLVIGTGLAYLVTRTDLPARGFLRVACALPLAVPPYVGAVVYADVLGPRGGLRDLLGVEELPSLFGFAGSALVLTLFTFPYVFLIAAAALRGLNPAFEEAARALGRGPLRVLVGTTARLVAPALAGGVLLVALYVLSDFGAVSLMRFDTFTTVIYDEIGGRFDPPGAAALSSVLVLLTLILIALALRVRGSGSYEQTGPGARRPGVRPLGRWRWPALTAVLAVLALALALPLARLGTWTWQVLPAQDPAPFVGWAWNSLLVSALAATGCVACALPVAALLVRRRRGGGWPDLALAALAQSGYALPGVVVALAVVALATRALDALYGTLPLLVGALVIRFLPQAVQGEQAGLEQIGHDLREAARNLGASALGVMGRVILPLLRPSLAAAWAVVFLTAVKELPATLILRPLGFDTLPIRVWTPARSGLYADAAPAALLLVIVSIVPLCLLLAHRREPEVLP